MEATRSHAYKYKLTDSVRGGNKSLTSNNTAEVTDEQYGYIDTFNSDGFTSTPGSGDNDYYNGTGKTYVAGPGMLDQIATELTMLLLYLTGGKNIASMDMEPVQLHLS